MEDTDGFTLVTRKGKGGKRAEQQGKLHKQPISKTSFADQPTSDNKDSREQTPGFYVASTRSKRNNRKTALQEQHLDNNRAVERSIYNVNDKRYTIKTSEYMAMFGRHLEAIRGFAPEEIVCYGMGSPSSSQVSQWQLALILEINDVFKLPVLAFDPVTSACDIEVLSKLGVSAIPENEEAKRRASRKTLFFMPHCEQFLYENVVAANWSKETLERVMVVGNRFSGYRDAQGGQEFADKSPHLARMIDSVTVIEFPSEKALKLRHCPYAFTDTSIQFIEPEKISLIKF